MFVKFISLPLVLSMVLLASGCGQPAAPTANSNEPPAVDKSDYLATEEPQGAQGIVDARKAVQNNDEVTLVGRIGGDVKPFVEGVAAFTIVDTALKPCEDGCETPWDYCCDLDTLPESKAMVKVVDAEGSTVPSDAKSWLGLKELQTVVVHGRAKRDEAGNLTVLADKVFVRP